MASVNKVILVGNLGRDVEKRTFPNGGVIAQASLATTDKWKDKDSGEQKEHTEWHRLVFNDRLAEIAAEYLGKGSQIYIEGALRTRKYTDKDGVEKYTTEIRVERMQMLGGRREEGGGQGDGYDDRPQQRQQPQGRGQQRQAPARQPARQQPRSGGSSGFDDMDDDIPF